MFISFGLEFDSKMKSMIDEKVPKYKSKSKLTLHIVLTQTINHMLYTVIRSFDASNNVTI